QNIRQALDNQRIPYIPNSSGMAAGTLTINTEVLAPDVTLNNTQIGLRAASKVLGQDVALSYYRGFFGVPVPAWSVATGSIPNNTVTTAVVYPRVQVLGVDAAGSIEKLGGAGWWAEAAVNFPSEVTMGIYETFTSASGSLSQLSFPTNAAGVASAIPVTPSYG